MKPPDIEPSTPPEMKIIAAENINIGTDIFPPLSPLAFSLYDSFLSSHCSSCFSLLPQPQTSLYCSAACSSSLSHSPIISPPEFSPILSSDIHTALRLLNSTTVVTSSRPHRLNGLLTNHHRLITDPSFSVSIKNAANFMAGVLKSNGENTEMEEAAICSVLTNAVEVQDSNGSALGIALYDSRFSWINHSCSPNSCYRFIDTTSFHKTYPKTKTISYITNTETSSSSNLEEGVRYGPKVIARSIKKIKNGEEITISYIDLLQPTGLRKSDLWSKYRFMCSCIRCVASPPAYVDSVLEGVVTSVGESQGITNKDEAMGKITDHIQETIDGFLSDEINPKSCCEKIENVLYRGIQIKANAQLPYHLWLHPIHHSALNGYITLVTAYRVRSVDSDSDMGKDFEMSRISAAYSLFLACASHHLFSVEPCLVLSTAKFWTNAGESLLDLARKYSMERFDVKCTKCHMVDTTNSLRDIEENSKKIMSCVIDISKVVWSFLSRGCHYLQKFTSPFDFSFVRDNGERDESSEDQMLSVLLLSFHCLLYADLLTDLCYGRKSHLMS